MFVFTGERMMCQTVFTCEQMEHQTVVAGEHITYQTYSLANIIYNVLKCIH